MAETRCEITELIVEQCAHCRGHADTPPADDLVIVRRFTAQYGGLCCSCGYPFAEDDRIGRTADGEYACAGCCDQVAGLSVEYVRVSSDGPKRPAVRAEPGARVVGGQRERLLPGVVAGAVRSRADSGRVV